MSEGDIGNKLRAAFPEGTVMDLDPILEMGKKRGLIHPVTCIDAVLNTMTELKGDSSGGDFFPTWNEVAHIDGCGKRACREVRVPMHVLKYGIPSGKDYDNLRHAVKQSFGWDRAEDVLVAEREKQLSDLLDYGEDPELILKLSKNLSHRGITAAAILNIPIEMFNRTSFYYGSHANELDKRRLAPDEVEVLDTAKAAYNFRRSSLITAGEEWFEILATQKGI